MGQNEPKGVRSRLPLAALSVLISLAALWRAGRPADEQEGQPINAVIADLRLDRVPVSDAIDLLSRKTGCNIVVDWKQLQTDDVNPQTLVDMHLHNVTLTTALEVMFDQIHHPFDLGYHFDHEVLFVDGTGDRPQGSGNWVGRVYDVQDLVDLVETPKDLSRQMFLVNDNVREDRLAQLISYLGPTEISPKGPSEDGIQIAGWAGRVFAAGSQQEQIRLQQRLADLRAQLRRPSKASTTRSSDEK